MGRPNLPKPEGFDAFAADHAGDEIAKHFKISRMRTNRHLREMPADWRKVRTRTLQIRAGRCSVAAAVKAAKEANTKPFPDGFVDVLMTCTRSAACKHFNMPSSSLYAMFKRLPADTQAAIGAASIERKRQASSRNAVRAAAASKAKRSAGKASGVNWGFNKPVDVAPAPGGIEYDAARFLMRRNSVVCRGETINPALKGYWIVGARPAMTPAEMLAMARAGGWNPDAWRVAA